MSEHGAVFSVLAQMDESWPPVVAARELARAGVPVFPCEPSGKRPMTKQGFHDASTDPGQIEQWWQRSPAANLAIPTGAASGVVVVDVDVHAAVDGFASFERARRAGLVDGWEMLVRTPSGGGHAFYPVTSGVEQRSWQAARAAIDFRGDGGYIVVPPSSRIIDGQRMPYRVERTSPGGGVALNAAALRDFLDPRPAPRAIVSPGVQREVDAERLASWVANRQEGERNAGLFWAACRLAENGIPASDALDALADAAGHAGLAEREVTRTVASAYRTVAGPAHARARGPERTAESHAPAERVRASAGRGL